MHQPFNPLVVADFINVVLALEYELAINLVMTDTATMLPIFGDLILVLVAVMLISLTLQLVILKFRVTFPKGKLIFPKKNITLNF